VTLDELISDNPEAMLGPLVAKVFGQLPFLLKLLAAGKPLSIQAHPDFEQARAGFARENEAGLDLAAPHRNYRDGNHKPEMICALTPFEAKFGFRPLDETRQLLDLFGDPRVLPLRQRLAESSSQGSEAVLAETVRWLLALDGRAVAELVAGLVDDATALIEGTDDSGNEAKSFRAELDWTSRIDADFPGDVGVAVALLLNHLSLQPGQAVFLGAGNLHAYLSGLAVEVMANSDNVLRGGLTAKHVDIDELLTVASYRPLVPEVQNAAGFDHHFRVPAAEFELIRYRWGDSTEPEPDSELGPEAEADPAPGPAVCDVWGPEILLVTEGSVGIRGGGDSLMLDQGEAVFVPYEDGLFELTPSTANAVVWRATVGR
jgi:mannose-6-phosphate isomerase